MSIVNGWRVSHFRDELRGRDVWTAKRHGVSMNTNTEAGILSMIRTRTAERIETERRRREA